MNVMTAPPRRLSSPASTAPPPDDAALLQYGDQFAGAAAGALLVGIPALAASFGKPAPFIGMVVGGLAGGALGRTLGRHVWVDGDGDSYARGTRGGWVGVGLAALGTAAGVATGGNPGAAIGAMTVGGLLGALMLKPTCTTAGESRTRPLSALFAKGSSPEEVKVKSLIYRAATNRQNAEVMKVSAALVGVGSLASGLFGAGWAPVVGGLSASAGLLGYSVYTDWCADRQREGANHVNEQHQVMSDKDMRYWERLASKVTY